MRRSLGERPVPSARERPPQPQPRRYQDRHQSAHTATQQESAAPKRPEERETRRYQDTAEHSPEQRHTYRYQDRQEDTSTVDSRHIESKTADSKWRSQDNGGQRDRTNLTESTYSNTTVSVKRQQEPAEPQRYRDREPEDDIPRRVDSERVNARNSASSGLREVKTESPVRVRAGDTRPVEVKTHVTLLKVQD